jgi:hemoglobin
MQKLLTNAGGDMKTEIQTLFERLGGKAAVNAAVELFYAKALADRRTAPWFDGVDMERQKAKQKGFLTMAFGGPTRYTGRDLRTGHADMVARGLGDAEVDAVIELLRATLAELGVPEAERDEVTTIANSVRNEVLGR